MQQCYRKQLETESARQKAQKTLFVVIFEFSGGKNDLNVAFSGFKIRKITIVQHLNPFTANNAVKCCNIVVS